MGAGALPSTLLSSPTRPTASSPDVSEETRRLRLENETLSAVVGVVASGPDLVHILDRVVDLLTRATDCHACLVYLRMGELLEMRAASPIYSHLVGKISFGVDESLAGWTIRTGEAAFIREGATEDPRTHYVPELEEERFQSMIAIPIPSREGSSIGAIVLHSAAPREFDEGILNVLSRSASLVAGAIENARLYEEARERVSSLTQLAALGREIAGVADRGSLFESAAAGVKDLVGADFCRIYRFEESTAALALVASSPTTDVAAGPEEEGRLVGAMLESGGVADDPVRDRLAELGGLGAEIGEIDAVALSAGPARIGALVIGARRPWRETDRELVRAAAQQIALAAQKIDLIERLTEENLARDLMAALADEDLVRAGDKASAAGLSPGRPHFVLELRPGVDTRSQAESSADAERSLRGMLADAFCDLSSGSLRAIVPAGAVGPAAARAKAEVLSHAPGLQGVAIGVSESRSGLDGMALALREAGDAARVAELLDERGEIVLYRDTGAYRYLIEVLDHGGPQDHLKSAVDLIAAYDRERGSQLLPTLDEYLAQGGSLATAARGLFVHVNTLRQRLTRIEELTGLDLADEDRLALQLAVKLGRVRMLDAP